MLPLRSVGRSNFDKGRHNLTTLIQETDIYQRAAELYNGINSGQYKKKITIYIYIYIHSEKTVFVLVPRFYSDK